MLPECRPNLAEVALNVYKIELACFKVDSPLTPETAFYMLTTEVTHVSFVLGSTWQTYKRSRFRCGISATYCRIL